MKDIKVCKFGGTSMATRESINRVIDIVSADMTDGRGIVRPGIPHALPLISSFNGAVVVSKVMISRFFFSLAKFLSIASHLV